MFINHTSVIRGGFTRFLTAGVLALYALGPMALESDFELGMRHEGNLTRAQSEADQEHDTALVLGGHARRRFRFGALTSTTLEAGLNGRWWTRFEDVSQLAADVAFKVRRRGGLDFDAPWVELSLSGTGLKHRDSPIRDGGVARAGLTGGRRFGHRFDARLGYGYLVRRAVEDVVFDLEQHEVFGQLDIQLGPRWLLYLEVEAREGELVSTAALPNARIRRHANAVQNGPDEAFGFGLSPITNGQRPRWTYQIDGLVLGGEVGVNYPLRPGLAIDIAAKYVQAYAAGDNEYDGFIFNAGLLWHFD